MGDFNIHVDNEKDALGSAFIDILNSIGVRQHVSGPTHSRNHTLDLILSHGIDVNGVEILQQSDDISDHYLVLCKLHIVKAVNSTPSYKYGRTITSTTKVDLAPAHTAKGTKSWFNDHGVTVLDWPANSPDLNPIENLWGIVKRKMRDTRPNNAYDLKAAIKATWASIPPQQCHKLITSMPRRIEAVIKAKGAPTKY